MAVQLVKRLKARRDARFHVQVELDGVPTDFPTSAGVPVEGRVIRVFRSDGTLAVGDRVAFTVHACREGDEIPPGAAYLRYDDLLRATHMETYLNGSPLRAEVPLDECVILSDPTAEPRMPAADVQALPRGTPGEKKWWQFWRANRPS